VEFRQRIDAADERAGFSFPRCSHDPAEIGAAALARAMQFQLLQIHRPQIELDDRAGDRAGRRVAAFGTQDFQEVVEHWPADEIGDDVDRLAVRRPCARLRRDRIATGHDGLGADVEHRLPPCRAGDCDRDGAARTCELDDAEPTPPDAPVTRTRSPAASRARSSMRSPVR
jgi:hypothetical protein